MKNWVKSFAIGAFSLCLAGPVLACQGDKVLYEDDFSFADSAWGALSPTFNVSNGAATLKPDANGTTLKWNPNFTFGDADMCVTMSAADITDATNAYGGMLFWVKDSQNFYAYVYATNGYFEVLRYLNGNWTPSGPVPWTKTDAIKQGLNIPNQLRVTIQGQVITLGINGTQVGRFRAQAPDGNTSVGMFAASETAKANAFSFQDLKVTNASSQPATAVNTPPATTPPAVVPPAVVPPATVPPASAPPATVAQTTTSKTSSGGACKNQQGNVVFEDTFKDDAGGWAFADNDLVLASPGAQLILQAGKDGYINSSQNQTFAATEGDYCVQMTFPANAAVLTDPGIGLEFLATDYQNYFMAEVYYNGKISLFHKVDSKWSTVWETTMKNAVKTGPGDANTIRVTVKGTTVTVYVNDTQVRAVRAQIPTGNLKFGFFAEYGKVSADPVVFGVRDVKVTAGQ